MRHGTRNPQRRPCGKCLAKGDADDEQDNTESLRDWKCENEAWAGLEGCGFGFFESGFAWEGRFDIAWGVDGLGVGLIFLSFLSGGICGGFGEKMWGPISLVAPMVGLAALILQEFFEAKGS